MTVGCQRLKVSPTKREEYCQPAFYLTTVPSYIRLQLNPLWGIKMQTPPLVLKWSYWRSCSGLNTTKKLHHVFHTSQADGQTKPKRGAVYFDIDPGHVVFSYKQTNGKTVKFLIHCLDETPVQTSNRLPWWQRCQLLSEDLRNFSTLFFSPYFLLNSFP